MQGLIGLTAMIFSVLVYLIPIIAVWKIFQISRDVAEIREAIHRLDLQVSGGNGD